MRRQLAAIAFCWLWICSVQHVAHAGACVGGADTVQQHYSPQEASLLRQLAAIRRQQQTRQCSPTSLGGFFNPCRDLANRASLAARQLEQLRSRAPRDGNPRPQSTPKGCQPEHKRKSSPSRNGQIQRFVKGTLLFCVRLEDGYFFPSPNSQFLDYRGVQDQLERCRSICTTNEMEVFVLEDPRLDRTEMTSWRDGKSYGNLPTAFRYRELSRVVRCDFHTYHMAQATAKARSLETPAVKDEGLVPSPTLVTKPAAAASLRATTDNAHPERRSIRVVLPFVIDAPEPQQTITLDDGRREIR